MGKDIISERCFGGALLSNRKPDYRNIIPGLLVSVILIFTLAMNEGFCQDIPLDLTDIDLEDLMNIEVVSVSKQEKKLSETAAAIFVITSDDIRRSGYTNIAEVLRLAPGLHVARVDANKWAISSRGFNSIFANKLLVLIDGRTVYNPLFSGVYWDVQDVLLEDVERIEVIRGPGATVWGANAVNGVINIITKNSKHTQGLYAGGGAGSVGYGFAGMRYGAELQKNLHYRVYGKYLNYDNFTNRAGMDFHDDWGISRAGFRLDWDRSDKNRITAQGDIYQGEAGGIYDEPSLTEPYQLLGIDESSVSGGSIQFGWSHFFTSTSNLELNTYFSASERDYFLVEHSLNSLDIDLMHCFKIRNSSKLIWGLGFRYYKDKVDSTETSWALTGDDDRGNELYTGFLQWSEFLFNRKLEVILGSKFEHNDYTGYEIQPTGRFVWNPNRAHTLWGTISRAVRTPSRFEHDGMFMALIQPPNTDYNPSPYPALVYFQSDSTKFGSEELIAYEMGYRFQSKNNYFFDICGFYNIYDHIRSVENISTDLKFATDIPHIVSILSPRNQDSAETIGLELLFEWQIREWFRLRSIYTHLQMDYDTAGEVIVAYGGDFDGTTPEHQFAIYGLADLSKNIETDIGIRYIDRLTFLDVDDYLTLDFRLGWQPYEFLELSLIGRNLLERWHTEFNYEMSSYRVQVERSVFGSVNWRF
ncbi:MAG: TonB-dependent receptor plug domain-containing protein [candidate division Zixibacteria bacterium]|nr:TonB-dependent receptor plug domain-containing protein [candidate division Zixibacteria bacterium]